MAQNTWQLEWNESLSVGIPEIDKEHQVFCALVNSLNQAIAGRMDIGEIQRRMRLIVDDAVQHFAHEEALFREWRYPDAEGHAQKHAQVLRELTDIMASFDDRTLEYEWIAGGLKAKDLLVEHLLTEDMKYRYYFRARPH